VDFQTQYQVLISMLLVGAFLEAVFEAYRQCHKIYKFRRLLLHFLDTCFWIMASLLVFSVTYVKAMGELRFYSLCFLGLGAIIHYVLLRKWTIKVTNMVIHSIKTVVRGIKWIVTKLIISPCIFAWRILCKLWMLLAGIGQWLVLVIMALVGLLGSVVHWFVCRCGSLFKKNK
jgi:spore cortex biosynthesis protein YabQ